MKFPFLIKKAIKKIFGIYSLQDWKWSYEDNPQECSYCEKGRLIPFKNNSINLFLPEIIKSGWYLFGIRHKGNNNRCCGFFKNGPNGYIQGRPMYPLRLRWRIVKINVKNDLNLKLVNIEDELLIENLFFFKIPSSYAFRRIETRITNLCSINLLKKIKKKKSNLWKIYNKLLNSQLTNSEIIKYQEWQLKVENFYKSIISKNKNLNPIKIVIQDVENINLVPQDAWAFPINDNYGIYSWSLKLIEFFLQISNDKDCLIFYGDDDFKDEFGKRYDPHFKSAWNRDLFLADPRYLNSCLISAEIWNNSLNFLKKNKIEITISTMIINSIMDLESSKRTCKIKHLPFILGFIKSKIDKKYVKNRGANESDILGTKKVLKLYDKIGSKLEEIKINKKLGTYQYFWKIPDETLLSIIIPTKDKIDLLKGCINSIKKYSPGCKCEIIVADNSSIEEGSHEYLREINGLKINDIVIKVVEIPGAFNYSYINNQAFKHTLGNVLLLLNNDTSFLSPNWGKELASNALRPDIGCVGAKLFYEDMTIQHGGVILGIGGVAGHSHKYFSHDHDGYQGRLKMTQNLSAVTAACLAISKEKWLKLGGLDEINLHVNYSDVDFCLRSMKLNLVNIFLPQVKAFHFESKSRGRPEGSAYKQWRREFKYMKKKWGNLLINDPYYSPYLSLDEENFSLSLRRQEILSMRNPLIQISDIF